MYSKAVEGVRKSHASMSYTTTSDDIYEEPMGRPRLRIGAHGTIRYTETEDGRVVARARVRLSDGRTRQVEGTGSSGAAAKRQLEKRIDERVAATGSNGLTGDTSVATLLDRWLASRRLDPTLGATSRLEYKGCIKMMKDVMGEVRLSELDAGVVDEHLQSIAARTPSRARQARTILKQACSYGVRHRVWSVSPVHDLTALPGREKRARSLKKGELERLRTIVRQWQQADARRSPDILAILDLGLATGCRIGELAGLRWEDVNLESDPAEIVVAATVVYDDVRGLYRQEHRKGNAPALILTLPEWARDLLSQQRERVSANVPWVFPSRAGTMRTPNNYRRSLRQALAGTDLAGVTPHTMRATVATWVKDARDLEAASGQLGHGDSAVTAAHYIERATRAPDVRDVLDNLGPAPAA